MVELSKNYVVFSPRDSRIPRIKIPLNDKSLPPDYVFGPSSYAEILFSAKITAWTEVSYAQGYVVLQYIIIIFYNILSQLAFQCIVFAVSWTFH